MSITANIHDTIRMEAKQSDEFAWINLVTDKGSPAAVHVSSYDVARKTADAFNAAMAEERTAENIRAAVSLATEAERKPVAAE